MYNENMNDEEFRTPEEIARENTIFLIVVVCIILSGIYVSKVSRDRINEARGYNKPQDKPKEIITKTDNKEKIDLDELRRQVELYKNMTTNNNTKKKKKNATKKIRKGKNHR